ncbi:GIY-YIG nuclease family protein, partial [Candidatus Parcubacteria bacterium]
ACADGDCGNEVRTSVNAINNLCSDSDCTNEINTGTNVVYRYLEKGVTRYIGITNNFVRRAGEHLRTRGWEIVRIRGLEHLSRSDARAVEQVLIEHYGLSNLYNQINSIAINNPTYQEAIQRGTEILRQIGFLE